MPKKTNVGIILLLLFYTGMHAQETQTGQLSQPTSSVYNRMRRMPPATESGSQQQARQFPNPAQQFPPEQRIGSPASGQSAPGQPVSQTVNQPQNGRFYSGLAPAPNVQPASQQPTRPAVSAQAQEPYGLALQPPNPPNITYANGELTIVANNASLAEIVTGIERATSVRVEGTRPDAERVFGQFGPGSPRDVLNSLFDGSRYDFILVGGLENPADVRTIILSPHGTAPSPGVSTASTQPSRPAENGEDQDESEKPPGYRDGEGQPVQNNVPSEQVVQPPPPPSTQQPPTQQQVKTPEQLLQELQRLRQQQQQQGQQPAPPTPR